MSRKNSHGNFTDPFGLLGRMLKSGNRAAYSALFREALRLGAIPFDSLLSIIEQRRLRSSPVSNHPLVFIVGAPRSGTTLIYQALAAFLDVTYPTNLTAMFPKSPLTTARLQLCIPSSRRPDFRNFYGQTIQLSGPNDAFHLWNHWLGNDRNLPTQSISDDTATDMRTFFDVWATAFHKPLLNKNNRNTFAVELLAAKLPNARFVVVRRNPMFVAQSLIIARQKVQGDKTKAWGLQSSSTAEGNDPLAYVDDVCKQIVDIDTELNRQLDTVSQDRIVNLTYEGFCEDPASSIGRIVNAFDGLSLAPELNIKDLPPFEISQSLSLTSDEQNRIQTQLQQSPADSLFTAV